MVSPVARPAALVVSGSRGPRAMPLDEVVAEPMAAIQAMRGTIASLAARVAALEGKPEEVAHFLALARLPTIAAAATKTITLAGLVPARPGDALKAGERVEVAPTDPLPDGVSLLSATVPSDGTVALKIGASVAIAAGAAAIPWRITALR